MRRAASPPRLRLGGISLSPFLIYLPELTAAGRCLWQDNVVGSHKYTPLHLAAEGSHTSTVETLIQGRADVNAVSVVRGACGDERVVFCGEADLFFCMGFFFCVCVCLFTYIKIYMYMMYMNIVHIYVYHIHIQYV